VHTRNSSPGLAKVAYERGRGWGDRERGVERE